MGLGDSTAPTGTPLTTSVTAAGFVGWNSFEDANLTSSPAALPITCSFTNREQVPKLRIQKELDSVEGATTDDITVTYRITATNDGALAGATGRLTDTPNFAPGLTVRSAAVAIYDNEALAGDPVSVLDGGSSFVTAPLETGKTCWLVETRAPAGHALLSRAVAFHIEVGADVDATTVIKTDFGADEGFSSVRVLPASGSLPGDRTPGIRVVDTQVGVPPKVGSIGIYPQLAGGAALLGLAGACAWRRRERTQAA